MLAVKFMLQLYHREISCCNNEVGWKHEEEKQTSLFPLEKHQPLSILTYFYFFKQNKKSVVTVYGLVSICTFSLAEERGVITPVGGAECKI